MEAAVNNRAPNFEGMSSPVGDGPCALCLIAPSRYTCPRCNVTYCGLSCYRGVRHRSCSEAFYRDEVLRGLQEAARSEGRKGDIEGILKRMREAQLRAEEEDGISLEDSITEEEDVESASPLDEDDTDTQALWKRLTLAEQKDFQRLLDSGGLGALVSPWKPWWESHEGPIMVQEVEVSSEKQQTIDMSHLQRHTDESQSNGAVTPINYKLTSGHTNSAEKKDTEIAETTSSQDRTAETARQRDVHDRVAEQWTEATLNVENPRSYPKKAGTGDTENRRYNTPLCKDLLLEKCNSNAILLDNPTKPVTPSKQRLMNSVEGQEKSEEAQSFRKTHTGYKQAMGDSMMLGGQKIDPIPSPKCLETNGVKGQGRCDAKIFESPKEKNVISIEAQKEQFSTILSQTPGLIGEEEADFPNRVNGNNLSCVPPTPYRTSTPTVPKAIPPLKSLTRSYSPLVQFSLVNSLYAYAFSLKLYNGDLHEDFILQEFCDVVLGISSALSSTMVFGSTAEALQAGIQAVLARGSHGDPQGGALAVAHILMGGSSRERENYTLAALSHLAGLLAKARKLAPKEKKLIIFNAKKKCQFLLSWANENKDALTLLSVEVQTEYKNYIDNLKEIEHLTHELRKSWSGSKPPEKKSLIQELD
ncbi:zinc finger HIT domain-containing protein 2 [Lissotriton helveticus]